MLTQRCKIRFSIFVMLSFKPKHQRRQGNVIYASYISFCFMMRYIDTGSFTCLAVCNKLMVWLQSTNFDLDAPEQGIQNQRGIHLRKLFIL